MKLSRYRPTRETKLELATTSMIDVVFLLLIFFLVTTTFLIPERQIQPNLRLDEKSTSATSQDIEPAVVHIVRQDGVPVYRLGQTVTTDPEIIGRVLERYPDKSRGAMVRLADDCPFGMAAKAISRCREAGFSTVTWIPQP